MPFLKNSVLLLFTTLTLCNVHAQSVQGVVLDERFSPIPGVNIIHTLTGVHTHSDANGSFSMEQVNINDTLEFSSLGFVTKSLSIQRLDKRLEVQLDRQVFSLGEVVIQPRIDALNLLTEIDLQVAPVTSSQEILRQVPGLFIGQHAGGGKAEQIFLRGFDIDHGTDIALSVDDMPVNMVSHAHGQGYSDLHFLIPETIDKVDFGKGPYTTSQGNFATAGHVGFKTKDYLETSSISLEAGQFSSSRLLGMFKVLSQEKQNAYIATEYIATDGPFESPQNFSRLNLMAKYDVFTSSKDRLNISLSTFRSQWNASGQIPQRKVDDGSISRFGAIDDTEGGSTSRHNIIVRHDRFIDDRSFLKTSLYLFDYDFELFSNFTFFLNDSINGDQIKQKEHRTGFGIKSTYNQTFEKGKLNGIWTAGISLRNDQITNNELSHTLNRKETLNQIALGDVLETNAGIFLDLSLNTGRFTIAPGLRLDLFDFQYTDALQSTYSNKSNEKAIVSPKFNVLFNQSENLQLYLKTGKGFHSNDTRVVTANQSRDILPAAYGADLGFIWKVRKNAIINIAVWQLFLEQEFVYVGDEGVVEPSGETMRKGVDLSARYQVLDWLYFNYDVNYTFARSLNTPEEESFIPLAPEATMVSGLNAKFKSGFYGGLNLRYMGDRPANEDGSIIAQGYSVVDMNLGYNVKRVDLSFAVQNLFNTAWNETQFATTTRLQNEPEAIEEIHFTPGTPFFFRGKLTYKF